MTSERPKTERASWIAGIVSAAVAVVTLLLAIWAHQSDTVQPLVAQSAPFVGPQVNNVSGGLTIINAPTNSAATTSPPAQIPSASSASPTWTTAPLGRNGAVVPEISSLPDGVSLPLAVMNRTALDGISGRWRSASDAGCLYAIQIEVRDDFLLWTNPRADNPLPFRVTMADTSEVTARSPDGKIVTFDVHTQSFHFKAEHLENALEYVRCL